jgi:hypothetical protein
MQRGWALVCAAAVFAALVADVAAQFTCPPPLPLNSTEVLQKERAACALDPECAELYGQADGADQAFFDAMRAVALEGVPLTDDYAVQTYTCNMSYADAAAVATQNMLKEKFYKFNPCGQGEEFFPPQGGHPGQCIAVGAGALNTCWQETGLTNALLVALAIFGVIAIVRALIDTVLGRPVKKTS